MSSPSLAFQAALGARLIAASAVTTLVPASNIFDRPGRPEAFPCIQLGEDTEVDDAAPLARDRCDVTATLHIWSREAGLAGAKAIAGAIRGTLSGYWTLTGWRVVDAPMVQAARFLRDPDGVTAHGVLTIATTLELVP